MTVITVAATDTGRPAERWSIPREPGLSESPVPRGLRLYGSTLPIAALGANDETNFILTFSFPVGFYYIAKAITLNFSSDDLTTEFSNQGVMEYRPGANQSIGIRTEFELLCDGAGFRNGATSVQNYRPMGTWRRNINGPRGDTLVCFLSDVSNDTSTAGDVAWQAEFWEYDVAQMNNWPIHTPLPTLTY